MACSWDGWLVYGFIGLGLGISMKALQIVNLGALHVLFLFVFFELAALYTGGGSGCLLLHLHLPLLLRQSLGLGLGLGLGLIFIVLPCGLFIVSLNVG